MVLGPLRQTERMAPMNPHKNGAIEAERFLDLIDVDLETMEPTSYIASGYLAFHHRNLGWAEYGDDCSYGRANVIAWREMFEQWEGVWWNTFPAGIGAGEFVVVRRSAPAEAIEALIALDEYPVLDDSVLSQLEMEVLDEAWDGYIEPEIRECIADAILVDRDDLTEVDHEAFHDIQWNYDPWTIHADSVDIDTRTIMRKWEIFLTVRVNKEESDLTYDEALDATADLANAALDAYEAEPRVWRFAGRKYREGLF